MVVGYGLATVTTVVVLLFLLKLLNKPSQLGAQKDSESDPQVARILREMEEETRGRQGG